MKKFKVTFDWSGYSRGHSAYEVEAETAEKAIENWYDGDEIEHVVVRDDTERDEDSMKAEEIPETP